MEKIKKGDEVISIAGKDKGRRGVVLKVLPDKDAVLVEGLGIVKKHVKANPNKGIDGGIVEKETTIHMSNIAIYNPHTKKADKVGIKFLEDGKKVRYFKSNNELIEV